MSAREIYKKIGTTKNDGTGQRRRPDLRGTPVANSDVEQKTSTKSIFLLPTDVSSREWNAIVPRFQKNMSE